MKLQNVCKEEKYLIEYQKRRFEKSNELLTFEASSF
jgi:hypothetical protein